MWRQLLRRVHPDAGGEHALFVWAQALREYVAGDAPEDVRLSHERRQPPPHPTTGDRIDYSEAFDKAGSFDELPRLAVALADSGAVEEPYARLLRLLAHLAEVGPGEHALYRQQHHGATYKQLAYAAHLAGMRPEERKEWYRIAEQIPLSQRHARHLIEQLRGERAV